MSVKKKTNEEILQELRQAKEQSKNTDIIPLQYF